MKENGKMTKLMDTEFTNILMDQNMKATGKMTSSMEMVLKLGRTKLVSKDNMLQEKSMELENLFGLMEVLSLEILLKITSKVMKNTIGQTEENMMVIGIRANPQE